jgi:hypothetical protein
MISDELKTYVNNDKNLIEILEQLAIDILRYAPKYNVGFPKKEYLRMNNYENETLVNKELLYGLYRMKLDELFDAKTENSK